MFNLSSWLSLISTFMSSWGLWLLSIIAIVSAGIAIFFIRRKKISLALYVDDSYLKLLFCQGEKVLTWSITPLKSGTVVDGVVKDPRQLTKLINAEVSKKGSKRCKRIITGISASHSICRILRVPDLPNTRPDVVIPQLVRRDFGYLAENNILRWKLLGNEVDGQNCLVLSVPKEPVSAMLNTLKGARIYADVLETSTLALCRAINQPNAIIASIEQKNIEIIIIRDNIPVLAQRMELIGTFDDNDYLITQIGEKIAAHINLYDDNNSDNRLSSDVPVYLFSSGISLNPENVSVIETLLGRTISEFVPPVTCPTDFPKMELAVNMGLILRYV